MGPGIANVAAIERARSFDLAKNLKEGLQRFADGGNFAAAAFGSGPRENRGARSDDCSVFDECGVRVLQIGREREHPKAATLQRGAVRSMLLQGFRIRGLAECPAR